jgi:hypothetical protein
MKPFCLNGEAGRKQFWRTLALVNFYGTAKERTRTATPDTICKNGSEDRELTDAELCDVSGGTSAYRAANKACGEAQYLVGQAINSFAAGNFGAGLKTSMEAAKAQTDCHQLLGSLH